MFQRIAASLETLSDDERNSIEPSELRNLQFRGFGTAQFDGFALHIREQRPSDLSLIDVSVVRIDDEYSAPAYGIAKGMPPMYERMLAELRALDHWGDLSVSELAALARASW